MNNPNPAALVSPSQLFDARTVGMTLRDCFAWFALQLELQWQRDLNDRLAAQGAEDLDEDLETAARNAYVVADVMLRARVE